MNGPAPIPSADPSPSEVLLARGQVVLAAILWSTNGFFAKAPFFTDWPLTVEGPGGIPLPVRGPILAFWRAVFAIVILLPLVRRPSFHLVMIPMTLAFGVMCFTFLCAMTFTTEANAIWVQNLGPTIIFAVGVSCLGEKSSAADWAALVCSTFGVLLILGCEWTWGGGASVVGLIYAFVSALCYAGVVLGMRVLRDEDSAWLIVANHLVAVLLIGPYALYETQAWPTLGQWVALAAFGMLQMGAPYFLFARAMRTISGHEAAGIGLLEPVLVPIWVWLIWSSLPTYEAPQWWTYAGAFFILGGLVLRYTLSEKKEEEVPIAEAAAIPMPEEGADGAAKADPDPYTPPNAA